MKMPPVKPTPDGDLSLYRAQLLPTRFDMAKAIAIVVVLAVGLRIAPSCRELWTTFAQRRGRSPHSESAAKDSLAGTDHGATERTEDRTVGDTPKVDGRKNNRSFITLHVKLTAAANPEPTPSPSILPESPAHRQIAKQPAPPSFASPPIAFFDNAGRSYASKAARDAAEDHRLAESLGRFPATKPKQHTILRQRAFARLEMLDTQQRINHAP